MHITWNPLVLPEWLDETQGQCTHFEAGGNVLELQGKTDAKKGPNKKSATPVVTANTVESSQQSPRHRIKAENASPPEFGEGISGLTLWESEYCNQEKKVLACG